ncbi:peptide ABC transporter substrate-binding protein [Vineibacter terrae]|uniref:Peptide ABC transporter substrate-binding protein n=1 Tax=Vineibacter terrae TaxID=2586908 RepID=A0A5C8P8S4_9HYPH|nr:peptide ABC transporter substrate-binding protein [Vineibacter terrae]TXL70195.1 peptide ABC transporter substrate-binding protein [Vineibacter terrae]
MSRDFPERDWRLLRELKPIALDRLCQRTLGEVQALCADAGKTNHQRYLALWDMIRERDDELAGAFDDLRRSTAVWRLTAMRQLGVLTDDEFGRFSEEVRDSVLTAIEILGAARGGRSKRSKKE